MKKFLSLLLSLLMLFCFFSCNEKAEETSKETENDTSADTSAETENENTTDAKAIDIYLIAGQSNAVGHSKVSNARELKEWSPYYRDGFSNIYYAGNSRYDDGKEDYDRDLPWQTSKVGLGYTQAHFGPELGMAKALSGYYNEQTGRAAGFIKYAHGGSSLLSSSETVSAYGNWLPPSYAKENNIDYTGIDGRFYRGLLEQVERNINELYEYGGFTEINIKGLLWFQGETDRERVDEYGDMLIRLISDLRKDVADIMLEFTNGKSDCGAADMAVFVPSMSQTYFLYDENVEKEINIPFIEAQKETIKKIDKCYYIDNTQFAITKFENGESIAVSGDHHHWGQTDMLTIGENIGKSILENCLEQQ